MGVFRTVQNSKGDLIHHEFIEQIVSEKIAPGPARRQMLEVVQSSLNSCESDRTTYLNNRFKEVWITATPITTLQDSISIATQQETLSEQLEFVKIVWNAVQGAANDSTRKVFANEFVQNLWRLYSTKISERPRLQLIFADQAAVSVELITLFVEKGGLLTAEENLLAIDLLAIAGRNSDWAAIGKFFHKLPVALKEKWLKGQSKISSQAVTAILKNPEQLLNLAVIDLFTHGTVPITVYKEVLPRLEGFDRDTEKLRHLANWFECDVAGPALLAISKSGEKLKYTNLKTLLEEIRILYQADRSNYLIHLKHVIADVASVADAKTKLIASWKGQQTEVKSGIFYEHVKRTLKQIRKIDAKCPSKKVA